MLPIRDHNPSLSTPWVTWALIAANIAVFLLTLPYYGSDVRLASLYDSWAMVPARISSGQGEYTILSSMFMHGGFWHLAGNMLFLWIFGDNLEDQMGHVLFLAYYLACGVAADVAQIAADPWSEIPTVGASGAIAGVMGGYLLLFPRARVDVLIFIVFLIRVISLPAWMMLGIWFGMQVISGALDPGHESGVAYWAHIGGFAAGFLLCLPLWFRRGGQGYWQANDGQPPNPPASYRLRRTEIPRVRRR